MEKNGKLRDYISWWPLAVADLMGVVGLKGNLWQQPERVD